MTDKERRRWRRLKKRVLTCLSGFVPVTPDGFQLESVTTKANKVIYVFFEKEVVKC